MVGKLLIANRGEIAVRIIRSSREMGIACVAVFSEPDRDATHVRMANEAYLIGPRTPSQSYLDTRRVLEAAHQAGADAIHPGYGFLAENAAFARAVVAEGLVWVGPHADAIDAMGDKLRARRAMENAGVPLVPGDMEPISDARAAHEAARRYGLPLALKASAGGGGKGLKVARSAADIDAAFATASREALAYFGDATLYAERYLDNPKHVELQILADRHGNVVHIGERDCSLQRRHQKVWEEAPALVADSVRAGMREAGIRAARAIGYDSAGTLEFLVSGDEFYFLEMNTRIQVEHTVTEMISGLDLVREQIRIASNEPLGYDQDAVHFRGAAIEGRINAEDPAQNFRPAPGTVTAYREPGGPGVRVDSAAYPGLQITPDYDSLIAKLVVWAPTREQALARMRRASEEFIIEGVPTTLPLLSALCDHPTVRDASYGTATLEAIAATLDLSEQGPPAAPRPQKGNVVAREGETVTVEVNGKLFRVRTHALPPAPRVTRANAGGSQGNEDAVRSPMHGVVVEIRVAPGQPVSQGSVVAVVEAMKMMNEIRAHRSGAVATVHVDAGATVEVNAPLVTIE